jgi:hypothetical protein
VSMSLGPLLPGEMYMHSADAHSSTQKVQCSRHATHLNNAADHHMWLK